MRHRITKVQTFLTKQAIDAALISNVSDILYLTGFSNFSPDEREAYLLVTGQKSYLITDGRYTEAVKTQVPFVTVLERTIKKPVNTIFASLSKKHRIKKLGFDEDDLSVAEFNRICNYFDVLIPFSLRELRIKKEASEITAIQNACTLGDEAFIYVLKQLKEGVTEKEIALLLEMFVKRRGADLSFPSIIAFGAHASVPHHQTGMTKLKKNSFVLLDFGTKVNNYCSDMTRTVFFGKPNTEQKRMHATVLAAQQKVTEYIYSVISRNKVTRDPIGVSPQRLVQGRNDKNMKQVSASRADEIAREYIIAAGYTTIPHSLGHGTGLEVHEAPSLSPKSKDELSEGMVFSIEPGIYVSGFGGIRIEDLFTIQNGKIVQLTQSSKEFINL